MILVLVDATAPVGPGDRTVLERALREVRQGSASLTVVVNKVDAAKEHQLLERLVSVKAAVEAIAPMGAASGAETGAGPVDAVEGVDAVDAMDAMEVEYFPVSARTGRGVDALTAHIVDSLAEGPPFFPDDVVTDTPEALWVAELVREQLLSRTHDELPHSISLPGHRMGVATHPLRHHRGA